MNKEISCNHLYVMKSKRKRIVLPTIMVLTDEGYYRVDWNKLISVAGLLVLIVLLSLIAAKELYQTKAHIATYQDMVAAKDVEIESLKAQIATQEDELKAYNKRILEFESQVNQSLDAIETKVDNTIKALDPGD